MTTIAPPAASQSNPPAPTREGATTRLYILGTGLVFPGHLTLQTLGILRSCRTICTNLPPSDLSRLSDDLRSKTTSLWSLYQQGRNRSDNYQDVAESILRIAEEQHPVAWLTPGHPLIFDSVSQGLIQACDARGWRSQVVPAVSCVDAVLADLGYDPANGLFVHEAQAVVFQDIPLLPEVATLLLQPSAFGSDVAHYEEAWRPDFAPLQEKLLRHFSADHCCAFVRSESLQGAPRSLHWVEIGALTSVSAKYILGSSLFIPAEFVPDA